MDQKVEKSLEAELRRKTNISPPVAVNSR